MKNTTNLIGRREYYRMVVVLTMKIVLRNHLCCFYRASCQIMVSLAVSYRIIPCLGRPSASPAQHSRLLLYIDIWVGSFWVGYCRVWIVLGSSQQVKDFKYIHILLLLLFFQKNIVYIC